MASSAHATPYLKGVLEYNTTCIGLSKKIRIYQVVWVFLKMARGVGLMGMKWYARLRSNNFLIQIASNSNNICERPFTEPTCSSKWLKSSKFSNLDKKLLKIPI